MSPGDRVTLRATSGEIREGHIANKSHVEGFDWLVEWEEQNFKTHERAADLRSAEPVVIARRGPGRAVQTHARVPERRRAGGMR